MGWTLVTRGPVRPFLRMTGCWKALSPLVAPLSDPALRTKVALLRIWEKTDCDVYTHIKATLVEA